MAFRMLIALSAAPLIASDSSGDEGALPDTSSVHEKCYSLMRGVNELEYSEAELSMLCRARLPVEICRNAAKELGERPWSPSTIGRVCGEWEEQWSLRAMQMDSKSREESLQEWEAQVDDIMKRKSATGVCSNKTVDDCVTWKREEYPKYSQELNAAMVDKHRQWHEVATENSEPARGLEVQSAEAREESLGVAAPAPGRGRIMAVGGAALAGVAATAVLGAYFLSMKRLDGSRSLVQPENSDSESQ